MPFFKQRNSAQPGRTSCSRTKKYGGVGGPTPHPIIFQEGITPLPLRNPKRGVTPHAKTARPGSRSGTLSALIQGTSSEVPREMLCIPVGCDRVFPAIWWGGSPPYPHPLRTCNRGATSPHPGIAPGGLPPHHCARTGFVALVLKERYRKIFDGGLRENRELCIRRQKNPWGWRGSWGAP
jgi:hypothetical protein